MIQPTAFDSYNYIAQKCAKNTNDFARTIDKHVVILLMSHTLLTFDDGPIVTPNMHCTFTWCIRAST